MKRTLLAQLAATAFALAATLGVAPAMAQQALRVGIVTFLSGPAAGPFGVPARNGFELVAEMLNAGRVPAPYAAKGFGGMSAGLVRASTILVRRVGIAHQFQKLGGANPTQGPQALGVRCDHTSWAIGCPWFKTAMGRPASLRNSWLGSIPSTL